MNPFLPTVNPTSETQNLGRKNTQSPEPNKSSSNDEFKRTLSKQKQDAAGKTSRSEEPPSKAENADKSTANKSNTSTKTDKTASENENSVSSEGKIAKDTPESKGEGLTRQSSEQASDQQLVAQTHALTVNPLTEAPTDDTQQGGPLFPLTQSALGSGPIISANADGEAINFHGLVDEGELVEPLSTLTDEAQVSPLVSQTPLASTNVDANILVNKPLSKPGEGLPQANIHVQPQVDRGKLNLSEAPIITAGDIELGGEQENTKSTSFNSSLSLNAKGLNLAENNLMAKGGASSITERLGALVSEKIEPMLRQQTVETTSVGVVHELHNSNMTFASKVDGRLQLPVNISFGQQGWGNMVAERSALMASQNIKFAELQLDPPELGPLQVKVSVQQDQASVTFVATNPQVKDALEQTVIKLRELLEEQGLNLADVDVSDQSAQEFEEGEDGTVDGEGDLLADDELEEEVSSRVVNATYGVDHYA